MFYRGIIDIKEDKIYVNIPWISQHKDIEILVQKEDINNFKMLEQLGFVKVTKINHKPTSEPLKTIMESFNNNEHYYLQYTTTDIFASFETFNKI